MQNDANTNATPPEDPPKGSPPTPALLGFLNGVHDRIVATFAGAQEASTTTRGNIREAAIAEIRSSLPAITTLCRGDIIDSFGAHTGQLDAIAVHANSPAVALAGEDRIVLAEGALSVLEVKSNLQSQWKEVISTWEKLKTVRRPQSRSSKGADALVTFQRALANVAATLNLPKSTVSANEIPAVLGLHERSIPYFVIGWKGWSRAETLQEKVTELHDLFGKGPRPLLIVAQLDPPGCGLMSPTGTRTIEPDGATFYEYNKIAFLAKEHDRRGFVLFGLWSILTDLARNASLVDIDWKGYLGMPSGLVTEKAKEPAK